MALYGKKRHPYDFRCLNKHFLVDYFFILFVSYSTIFAKMEMNFYPALSISVGIVVLFYYLMIFMLGKFGIQF
jgi:hypothetical protein